MIESLALPKRSQSTLVLSGNRSRSAAGPVRLRSTGTFSTQDCTATTPPLITNNARLSTTCETLHSCTLSYYSTVQIASHQRPSRLAHPIFLTKASRRNQGSSPEPTTPLHALRVMGMR